METSEDRNLLAPEDCAEDLRAIVGKQEEKRSLNTRDPREAKQLHAIALAEVDTRWAHLKAGPRALSEREAHALARPYYDEFVGNSRTILRFGRIQESWAMRGRTS